ncbi:MAG: hypothetical protein RBT75_02675, partial [Anaerolineae bacterium]|nr:hypothetical protein [Anaerolineae bacterium]
KDGPEGRPVNTVGRVAILSENGGLSKWDWSGVYDRILEKNETIILQTTCMQKPFHLLQMPHWRATLCAAVLGASFC